MRLLGRPPGRRMIPESEKGRSLAGTDAVRPAFRAHLRVETVPGEGVYLISERSVTALRGSQAVALCPLLDGSRDLDAPAVQAGLPGPWCGDCSESFPRPVCSPRCTTPPGRPPGGTPRACLLGADIEARELRYFIAVAEELNFTRGSERLGMAQPPLSVAIGKLERKLGVSLRERNSRRVSLTPAGTVLLEHGRIALEGLGAAVERTKRRGPAPDRLTVAVKADGSTDLLREVLRRCADQPGMPEVTAEVAAWGEPSVALREGTADVALLRTPFEPRGLDTEVLLVEPRVAVLPAGHRLAGRKRLRRADLAGEPMPRWAGADERTAAYWAGRDPESVDREWPDERHPPRRRDPR
ncbi:LysR family transcriptional regulator [Streptomyces cynarae]|uniref:LysR family transcriptional regulator n=1 Tax=Streptomyces cynarae TaxID=2981134 RepID=A0ABY6E396_9ACTN|nr:LysR family transcriptional regulator [Streptomyces cynarae]UXY21110.1 LysR family transcriptional regulator [Streptomyces cynarae]